jgi:hypothetical protein
MSKIIVQREQIDVNKKVQDCANGLGKTFGWNQVLEDADIALRDAKNRVRSIKRSIRIVKLKASTGEPFPDYLKSSTQI